MVVNTSATFDSIVSRTSTGDDLILILQRVNVRRGELLCNIQLFRQRLSHKSVKVYATMPNGIMGRKSLALIDGGSRCLPTRKKKA